LLQQDPARCHDAGLSVTAPVEVGAPFMMRSEKAP
jgi:hypothetical protein